MCPVYFSCTDASGSESVETLHDEFQLPVTDNTAPSGLLAHRKEKLHLSCQPDRATQEYRQVMHLMSALSAVCKTDRSVMENIQGFKGF